MQGRMQGVVQTVEAIGLYRPARTFYQRTLNRGYWRERQALARLLARFVHPRDLVFDVGANSGGYVAIFLGLGARVVAIEANPSLARLVARRYRVDVEAVAAGSASGESVLHLGRRSGHSTVSDRWLERAPSRDRWSGRTIKVPVVRMDDLIAKYGQPAFVKVDVEGAEADVLRGVSHPLRALSFEFQASDLSVAQECIALLEQLGSYRFWFTNAGAFELQPCNDAQELRDHLGGIAESDPARYGDVYAQLGSEEIHDSAVSHR